MGIDWLDCTGGAFDIAWTEFHTALTSAGEDTPSVRSIADHLVRLNTPLAQRQCLNYDDDAWYVAHVHRIDFKVQSLYNLTAVRVFGQLADPSHLNGFCIFGYVTALSVVGAATDKFDLIRTALRCLGPHLGIDFLDDSRWPVRSKDLRFILLGWPSWNDFIKFWLQTRPPIWYAGFYDPVPVPHPSQLQAAGRASTAVRVSVFGVHAALNVEPITTLALLCRVEAKFYGMRWPSDFACKVLNKCEPDNVEMDAWIAGFLNLREIRVDNVDQVNFQKRLQLRLKTLLQTSVDVGDMLICTESRLCIVLGWFKQDVPIFGYLSGLLTFTSSSQDEDLDLLGQLDMLIRRPGFALAATTPLISAFALYQSGHIIPVVRPLAQYIAFAPIVDATNVVLFAKTRLFPGTAHGITFFRLFDEFNFAMGLPILWRPGWGAWLDFSDMSKYKSVVIFPHEPVQMSLYEFYRCRLPVFVCDHAWMVRLLALRGHRFDFRDDSYMTVANGTVLSLFEHHILDQYSDNIMLTAKLTFLIDFYILPHLVLFSSITHLIQLLIDLDGYAVRVAMQNTYARIQAKTLDFYRSRVLPLRLARSGSPLV